MAQDLVTTSSREAESILDNDNNDFVTFEVNNQLFGISVLKVQDILKLKTIALVPLSSPEIKGTVNIRGRIVTVISMRVCLGIGEREEGSDREDATGMGVTIEQDKYLYALQVDSIGDIITVSSDCHEATPSTLDPVWREFSLGVYRLETRLMIVLDVDRVLNINA